MFQSPSPVVWDGVYKRLIDWHRVHCTSDENRPPVPLILAGRAFSSPSLRHERWLQTVDWAQRHGCPDIVAISGGDFEVCDPDIPGLDSSSHDNTA